MTDRLQCPSLKSVFTVMNVPYRQIRAVYNEQTIRVYQAYSPGIAEPAVKKGTFVSPPFKIERMTWIKPSFLWMMYRCGWASKSGQEKVLAIDISREGFHWALLNSCLSHYENGVYSSEEEWKELKESSPVRIQWDPERDVQLEKLDYRSIQIGLSGEAVKKYVNEWITNITDITDVAIQMRENPSSREGLVPTEQPYFMSEDIMRKVGVSHHFPIVK